MLLKNYKWYYESELRTRKFYRKFNLGQETQLKPNKGIAKIMK